MPRDHARPRLLLFARKAGRGSRIDDLMARRMDQPAHVGFVGHRLFFDEGREMAVPYPDLAALQRPSLRLPFLKTAIQQRDIMRAEHPDRKSTRLNSSH